MKMDRRHFCKVAALAAGAIGIGNIETKAAPLTAGCKITVLRRECYEDLQNLFLDDPETGRCDIFYTGQSFIVPAGSECPEGFCPTAFESIKTHIDGSKNCTKNHPGIILASCPDGSRPVIFKIETNYNR